MNTYAITLDLPEPVYERIERAARAMSQPLSQALTRIVEAGLPSLARAPKFFQPELEAMESFSDAELWRLARGEMAATDQDEIERLLRKNESEGLDTAEETRLDRLHSEADKLMLRKSYALLLLKWRGYVIPVPSQS
ncbi:MAG: hypothetical protein K1X65_00705 [Caldilineales bacterium]|nr:hypothetical protein [Caldilineales bacterium]MCW5860432.1 hypothetical protein [Caldilineales bacterium]